MTNSKIQLMIKPLSVNKAWQGKRFKTKSYKQYEKILLMMLPKDIETYGKMELHLRRGFSSTLSDTTNPIKLFEDILQKSCGVNDRYNFRVIAEKEIVPKGKEYIMFKISKFEKLLDR